MTRAVHETLRQRLARRRHTALLVAIVTALAMRPLVGDAGAGPVLFSLALLGVLILALVTVQVDELAGDRELLLAQRRRRIRIAWALAIPAVAERLYTFIVPSSRQLLIGSIAWFLFLAFVTWNQLRILLKQKTVTGESISMSISIYLLLGLTWGMLYIIIFQLDPHAFDLGAAASSTATAGSNERLIFPVLIYFSLVTIATVGFGEIAPVTLQAQYAAVAEGITGQFYLAILVARLVGMHMAASLEERE